MHAGRTGTPSWVPVSDCQSYPCIQTETRWCQLWKQTAKIHVWPWYDLQNPVLQGHCFWGVSQVSQSWKHLWEKLSVKKTDPDICKQCLEIKSTFVCVLKLWSHKHIRFLHSFKKAMWCRKEENKWGKTEVLNLQLIHCKSGAPPGHQTSSPQQQDKKWLSRRL